MGFFAGLFVNSFLVAIPIGATLGVLFAIRPFEGEREILLVQTDGIQTQTSCDEFHTFLQNKHGINYTLNSNEVRSETNTVLCSTVTTFQNSTYPGNTTVPEFSVTWSYPYRVANESSPANETAPAIHAFPQARIADGGPLPIKMEDIGALNIDFAWTMGMGKNTSYATNTRRLSAENVNTTVALDMYLDSDSDNAAEASKAATEMIIFFARFSDADPVGFGNGTVIRTQSVEGVDFHLFVGKNAADQNVFSWVSARPLYEFKGDIAPLFDGVMALRGDKRVKVPLPSFFDYLGYVGFGTQAFNADDDVTFYVPRLSIDVQAF